MKLIFPELNNNRKRFFSEVKYHWLLHYVMEYFAHFLVQQWPIFVIL